MPHHISFALLGLIFVSGLYAGTQNALAGGGSFITFPTLVLAGLTPLAANMTSTVALFPNQITTGYAGRKSAGGVSSLSLSALFWLSLVGGGVGALLLIYTPASFFERLVPWLILFATAVFAWGSFFRKSSGSDAKLPLPVVIGVQFLVSIYGGYFGGGIGFLMLAILTIAGQQVRMAAATKNVLAMAMNLAAVLLFAGSSQISWPAAIALALGGIGGAFLGNWAMHRVSEKALRVFIVMIGVALTIWFFIR